MPVRQFRNTNTDAADANNIMRGQARVTQFGTFKLKKNPSWRYTSSLDSSGNANMHALHWALPLLRYGLRTGNTAMVNRFYTLVFDWIRTIRQSGPARVPLMGRSNLGSGCCRWLVRWRVQHPSARSSKPR